MNDTVEILAAFLALVACLVLYVASALAWHLGVLPFAFPALFCGCSCVASVLALVAVWEVR